MGKVLREARCKTDEIVMWGVYILCMRKVVSR